MERLRPGYPGFGEKPHEKFEPLSERISSIAIDALYKGSFIAVCSVIGAGIGTVTLLNPLAGALAGAVISTGLLILAKSISPLFHSLFPSNIYNELPVSILEKNRSDGPPVGSYSPCNLIVLNSAEEVFQKKLELIDIAEESIECSFNFAGGAPFDKWLERLEKRFNTRPQLTVHLIISSDLLTPKNRDKLEQLKRQHPHFHYLITDRKLGLKGGMRMEENHVKAIVVDEKYFVSGGTGVAEPFIREDLDPSYAPNTFGDKVMFRGYRDTDLMGEGKLAKTLRSQFFNLYQIWLVRSGKKASRNEGIYFSVKPSRTFYRQFQEDSRLRKRIETKLVVCGPEHRRKNPITQEYLRMIEGAKKTITFSNLYFNPPRFLRKAIEKKKREGVKTIGYFNGTTLSDKELNLSDACSTLTEYFMTSPCRSYYHRDFDTVYEFQKPKIGKHKKVAVIDDTAVIGSYNLGTKSHENDYEMIFICESPLVAKDLLQGINEDKINSQLYQQNFYSLNLADRASSLVSKYFLKGLLL